MNGFDVRRKIFAIFKVEILLAALLSRTGEGKTLLSRVAKNGRAKLLIHQDGGLLLRHAVRNGLQKAVVDHLLGRRNLCGLVRRQLPFQPNIPV